MNSRKVVKYIVDGTAIDSNRSIDFKKTVSMPKITEKLDLISVFYSQFPLTRVNFMSHNLTILIIRLTLMLLKCIFFKK